MNKNCEGMNHLICLDGTLKRESANEKKVYWDEMAQPTSLSISVHNVCTLMLLF